MNSARRGRAATVLAALSVVLYVIVAAVDPQSDPAAAILFGAAVVSFWAVGALLVDRVPGHRIGPLLLVAGALMSASTTSGVYATVAMQSTPDPLPGAALAAMLIQILFIYPIVIVLIGVPLVFPDGHLPSPRFRWVAILTILAMAALTVSNLFAPATLGAAEIPNPWALPALTPILDGLGAFASVTSIVGFGGAAIAVFVRYRRGTPVERQQVKWFAAVAGLAAIAFPVAFLSPIQVLADVMFMIGFIALIALPSAIGLAILRYRLYEIDRIISRTIGWALVTGLLIAVFAVGVVGLQALLVGVTQGATVAVAASTLAAFALFQPVRRRVQAAVDRRFDRAHYDATQTAAAFAELVRDEVDLERLLEALDASAVHAVRPLGAAVWLPGRADR